MDSGSTAVRITIPFGSLPTLTLGSIGSGAVSEGAAAGCCLGAWAMTGALANNSARG